MRVDVAKMARMITKNTAMLVASAPQFPHGCIDPIPDIGQLGIQVSIKIKCLEANISGAFHIFDIK